MSNFSLSTQTAILAADAVARLIDPSTNSATRASIARHNATQTKPYIGAFRGAIATHNRFVQQINAYRISKGTPLKQSIDPITFELVD